MGKPYSQELREAVIEALARGRTREQIARDYEVSLSSVARFIKRWRETGNVGPHKFGGHKPYALKQDEEAITQWLRREPAITLKQLQARLLKQHIVVSKSSIARFRDHLDPEAAAKRRARRKARAKLSEPVSGPNSQ